MSLLLAGLCMLAAACSGSDEKQATPTPEGEPGELMLIEESLMTQFPV